MELKISAIIILILFIINSGFSVFYKNNVRVDVSADTDSELAIFAVNTDINTEVIQNENTEDSTIEAEEPVTTQTQKNKVVKPPVQTPPSENTQPTQPPTVNTPETPQEPPTTTPPTDNDDSDYVPPPSDDIFGPGG